MQDIKFYPAPTSGIVNLLEQTVCSGHPALYDAIAFGTQKILELHKILDQFGSNQTWQSVHIVVTDGGDTSSNMTIDDLIRSMQPLRSISQKQLEVSFLAIDVPINIHNILVTLADQAGNNGTYYSSGVNQLPDVFNKILVGIKRQKLSEQTSINRCGQAAYPSLVENGECFVQDKVHFAVLLSLNISSSMSGEKWTNVVQGVNSLMNVLEDTDVISCIVFNQQPVQLKLLQPASISLYPALQPPQKNGQGEQLANPKNQPREAEQPLLPEWLKKRQSINHKFPLAWNFLQFFILLGAFLAQMLYFTLKLKSTSSVCSTLHFWSDLAYMGNGVCAVLVICELMVLVVQSCQKVEQSEMSYKTFSLIKIVVICTAYIVLIAGIALYQHYLGIFCADLLPLTRFQVYTMAIFILTCFVESQLIYRFTFAKTSQLKCFDHIQSFMNIMVSGFQIVMGVLLLILTYSHLEPNASACRIMYKWCKYAPYYLVPTNLIPFLFGLLNFFYSEQFFKLSVMRRIIFVSLEIRALSLMGNIAIIIGFATFVNEKRQCHQLGAYSEATLIGLLIALAYTAFEGLSVACFRGFNRTYSVFTYYRMR